MIIVFAKHATQAQIQSVERKVKEAGMEVHRSDGIDHSVVGLVGDLTLVDIQKFKVFPGVSKIIRISSPYKLASREFHPEDTVVQVRDVPVGGKDVAVMAGPCAIETEEQMFTVAKWVAEQGVRIIRGGAFKPRTSPYAFAGLGEEGLRLIRQAADRYGLAVVTEVMSSDQIGLVAEYGDLLQVGARNMQNFSLLKELGKCKKPVLLKRGLSATIQEWLMSAEHVLAGGNPNVILCERGIRTFETATRSTLDLSSVPLVKHLSHLPIVVDPSHSVGNRTYVAAMARASVAAGADGILVEVHNDPDTALCDGAQSITHDEFTSLMNRCRIIATTLGRRIPQITSHEE